MLHVCNVHVGIIAKCSSSFGVFAFLRLWQLIAAIAMATCDNTNCLRSCDCELHAQAGALFVMCRLSGVRFRPFIPAPFISFLSSRPRGVALVSSVFQVNPIYIYLTMWGGMAGAAQHGGHYGPAAGGGEFCVRLVPQSFYFHSVLADTCSTIKTIV